MKLSCQIVQDLLPLYLDEVCSEASRTAVQTHLRECDACRKLARSTESLPPLEPVAEAPTQEQAVRRSFKKVRRRWIASLLAVLMLLPLAGLGSLGYNQYQGTGICFSNLYAVWNCSRFVSALENKDYEKAVSYMNFDDLYDECQEAINLQPEDFTPQYTPVTIGEDTWMVKTFFAQEYLGDTQDVQNTWCEFIYNGIYNALIPEDVWYTVTALGDEAPIPEGSCYRLPTGHCYYRLETQWGNFMIHDSAWDCLQQIGYGSLDLAEIFAMLPEEMYLELKPEMEAQALATYQQLQAWHADIIGMDREEFASYMTERYIRQLESLDTHGYTIEGTGFRDAYCLDRWVISYGAQVSSGQTQQQFYFNFDMRQGKISGIGASYRSEPTEFLETVLDILRPSPH